MQIRDNTASFTVPPFAVDAFKLLDNAVVLVIPCNMKNLYIPDILKIPMHFNHGRVDAARPAAAAGDEEREFMRVQPQQAAPFFLAHRQNILADRISRIYEIFFFLKPAGCFPISQGDAVGKLAQNQIGHAGDDVLLLHERRNAAQAGRQQHGAADESARTDDDFRLKPMNNAFGLKYASRRLSQSHYVAEGNAAFQSPYVYGHKRQSFFRNQRIFQPYLRAYVEKLRRLDIGNSAGNCYCRIDMAACSAS